MLNSSALDRDRMRIPPMLESKPASLNICTQRNVYEKNVAGCGSVLQCEGQTAMLSCCIAKVHDERKTRTPVDADSSLKTN